MANHANSQPHIEAISCISQPGLRSCDPKRYCKVPKLLSIAERGIQACTVRMFGNAFGKPMASSSRCQCVSLSPGSFVKPRSMSRQSSEVPASSAAALHRELFRSAMKAATTSLSSWTAKVKRTSFWPPSSAKARRPCSSMSPDKVCATPSTSARGRAAFDSKWPLARKADTASGAKMPPSPAAPAESTRPKQVRQRIATTSSKPCASHRTEARGAMPAV
mmetsp:Transcript_83171/g.231447  ORF Transcript_83171/g.231447 Transcript_83171/m.231447 type:complete len:220 (+) Transcript_83171:653-1312(+)